MFFKGLPQQQMELLSRLTGFFYDLAHEKMLLDLIFQKHFHKYLGFMLNHTVFV